MSPTSVHMMEDVIDSPQTVSGTKTPESSQGPAVSPITIEPLLSNAIVQDTKNSILMHFDGVAYKPTIPHKNMYAGHPEQDRLFGRLEGMLVGQWAEKTGLGLKECYKLVGISSADAVLVGLEVEHWTTKRAPSMRGGKRERNWSVQRSVLTNSGC
jgi:hypothetical protein